MSKNEMIRVVKDNTGKVFIDTTGKANGRGAYLKRDKNIVKKARQTKQLDKHLEINVPEDIYNELEAVINEE